MREQKWKLKVNSHELFTLHRLVSGEIERLGELSRTGVGLTATAAWDNHKELWPLYKELERLVRQP